MDRLFDKLKQKSHKAEHIRIRLIEPCVDIDSLIKSLLQKLAQLRERDPVLLHIDTAGVSMRTFFIFLTSCSVVGCTSQSVISLVFFPMSGSFRS